ncbi:MAG: bacterial regulatory helix-turn-helix, lysR family protein [Rhizobacter sp.]|nr:bacterial regulatory helix-turn-helix, lysR family protein [Rhizobacter sp.]
MSPFDLNLRHLRGLMAVCDEGSISAAAHTLNLSQPALTQGLMKLETQLGHALFERRTSGVVPTDAGRTVAERVRAALTLLAEGAAFAAGSAAQAERRLSMTSLRAFTALAEAGDFASASARVGLSQTAVHRGVRDLEAALDKKLVERRGRGVYVNFTGQRFLRACRLAHAELQAAFFELGVDSQPLRIAIGTTPLARAFLVPEAMAMMMSHLGPAGFQVFEGSWGELVDSLRDGVIDLIVGELPSYDSPDICKTFLCEEPVVIAAGHLHPLVGAAAPDLQTLASYPWILAPENSPLRAAWNDLFEGLPPPTAPIECGSIMIIGRLLTSSHMLTLATPDQVALQIKSGLLASVPCPVQTLGRLTVGITTRRRWRPTSVQQIFLDSLATASMQIGKPAAQPPRMAVDWNDAKVSSALSE